MKEIVIATLEPELLSGDSVSLTNPEVSGVTIESFPSVQALADRLKDEHLGCLLLWTSRSMHIQRCLGGGREPDDAMEQWHSLYAPLPALRVRLRGRFVCYQADWLDADCAGHLEQLLAQKFECRNVGLSIDRDPVPHLVWALFAAQLSQKTGHLEAEFLEEELVAISEPMMARSRDAEVDDWWRGFNHWLQEREKAALDAAVRKEQSAEMEGLRRQLSVADEQTAAFERLSAEHENVSKQLAEACVRLDELVEEGEQKQQRIDQALADIQRKSDTIASLNAQLKQGRGDLEALEGACLKLQEEIEEADERLQSQLTSNAQARQALNKAIEDSRLENGALRQQVQKLEAERDSLGQVLKANEIALQEKEALEQQVELLRQQETAAEELGRDNALLLQQLQYVQEELEYQFALNVSGEHSRDVLEDFKSSLLLTHPEYCSAKKIVVISGDSEGDYQNLNLNIEGFEHFEEFLDQVNVKLLYHEGHYGLELRRNHSAEMHVMEFEPTGADEFGEYLTIFPGDYRDQSMLVGIGENEFLKLRGLLELIRVRMQAGLLEYAVDLPDSDLDAWIGRVQAFESDLLDLRSGRRRNTLELIEYFKSEGYEHLWLRLGQAMIGQKYLPSLSFKLAAKGIGEDGFADFGALEFRDQEHEIEPFDNWPPDTEDEFGAVLNLDCPSELTPEQQHAWESLTPGERKWVSDLLSFLGSSLPAVYPQSAAVERSITDWLGLIQLMQQRAGA